jgi:hypothetical protein
MIMTKEDVQLILDNKRKDIGETVKLIGNFVKDDANFKNANWGDAGNLDYLHSMLNELCRFCNIKEKKPRVAKTKEQKGNDELTL